MPGITKRVVKVLFSPWSLKKRVLDFIEKVKKTHTKKKSKRGLTDSQIEMNILILKYQKYKNCY